MHIDSPKIAGLLTIGTEVTDGQILNTNSKSLAEKLNDLSYNVTIHMSVQDDELKILEALEFISKSCNEIFITGGLGPTNDDITRFAVAKFLGLETKFDDNSWEKIKSIFKERGIEVADTNKRQCIFPSGAKIIDNSAGTANAFSLKRDDKNFYILPGPPREIEAIWNEHLSRELKPSLESNMELIIWKLLGIRESSLAEMIEPIIDNSKIILGYRPHLPYIELKLWVNTADKSSQEAKISKIRSLVDPWYVSEGSFNPYEDFCSKIEKEILLVDKATDGLFAQKIRPYIKGDEHTIIGFVDQKESSVENYYKLEISELSEEAYWEVNMNGHRQKLELPFKYRKTKAELKSRYISEITILELLAKWNKND